MNEEWPYGELKESVKNLRREIAPHRDLWPGIEHAIEAKQHKSRPKQMGIWLSSAAAVVFVASFVAFNSEPINDQSSTMVSVAFEMDRGFEAQKAQLLASYEGVEALTNNWKDQLVELESARIAIKESLEEDPDNFYLIKALQNIHEQQIGLIERVHKENWNSI